MPHDLATTTKTVTPAEALKLVQDHVKAVYAAAKKAPSAQFKAIAKEVGGQVDKLDRSVVEDLKKFAIRLAAIARRSATAGYNTSKAAPAIQGVSKKLFMAAAELESVVANDVEIPLFEPPKEMEFFGGNQYGYSSIRNEKAATVERLAQEYVDDGGAEPDLALREFLTDSVGAAAREGVEALLAGVSIVMPEPTPEEPEPEKPVKAKRQPRTRGMDGAVSEEPDDEGDGE